MVIDEYVDVKAPPAIVWKALIEERKFHKTNVGEVINLKDGQKFYLMTQAYGTPLGEATVKFAISELEPNFMTFTLIESNVFKSVSGGWSIWDFKQGSRLQLQIKDIALKDYFPVPVFVVKNIAMGKIKSRLKAIKKAAESEYKQ